MLDTNLNVPRLQHICFVVDGQLGFERVRRLPCGTIGGIDGHLGGHFAAAFKLDLQEQVPVPKRNGLQLVHGHTHTELHLPAEREERQHA